MGHALVELTQGSERDAMVLAPGRNPLDADELNERPRLCLKDKIPAELLRRWERQYALH